jgi:hypothetical protein
MRHPHLLARRAQVQAALIVQPMRTGAQAAISPALPPLELGNEGEPPILRGIQLAGEFGDLRLEIPQRDVELG